jgi:uncharacterized membrane protein YeaQ/YmgE (transglycosylase-associated protein family)
MRFTVLEIAIILAAGLVIGLLPSTIADRKGFRFVGDIAVSVAGVFVAAWLVLSWHDVVSISEDLLAGKPADNVTAETGPNYEPVVLPLASLRPLLKPVVYRSREEICDTLVRAANNNDLPVHFFIRLLYQESSFRPAAISTAGAFGIAQFMPETATDRRLDNPFDPAQAIPASARLLRDLYRKFGNLGLAAAAYNAGPRRIEDWRANKGPLPQETRDYVKAITGWPVETWTDAQAGGPAFKIPREAPCQEAAGLLAWNGPDEIPLPAPNPRTKESANASAVQPAAGSRAAKPERGTKTIGVARK